MEARKLTAIIACNEEQVNGSKFLKYRNIPDTDKEKEKFKLFAAKFPGAVHINLYDKQSRKFIEQIKLQQ